ncbi:two-pore potassium channel 1-like [Juglans microcarpa x Juglans regia]|uniref:two-pore potassium channel 1-like n=1 Tax=Juglans microcarpa x Juglans regia TaxID=2249226 RepID=UPI001B7DE430|nr:two-pore potassium channel 1-like [Juglans microcarpa x Juglans regia]
MASNDAKVKGSSLSGLVNPTSQTNMTDTRNRRRYQRGKRSVPARSSFSMQTTIGSAPTRPCKSIIEKIDPDLMHVAIFLAVYIVVGTLCFYNLRPQMKGEKTNAIIDTVYFCIVTMATVGYGDLVPDSVVTKLLACVFAFTGLALVGLVLSKAADTLVKKHEDLLVKALQMYQSCGLIEETNKEVKINGVRYKCLLVLMLLVVLIITGTTFLATVEKLDLIDAFYCVCITITTLGYGDESFKTKGGRVFAVFWILTSTITLAQFFAYVAELKTESRHRELFERVLGRKMTDDDLEKADVDDDSSLETAEFILYMLQDMGKITKDDISLVKEELERLDVDQSRTLSVSDIMVQADKVALPM